MTPSDGDPRPVGEVLGAFLEARGLQGELGRQRVLEGWSAVVGEAVAENDRCVPAGPDQSILHQAAHP